MTILEQLAAELENRKAQNAPRPASRTFLPMGALLDPEAVQVPRAALSKLMDDYTLNRATHSKHSIVTDGTNQLGRALYEDMSFFQDCALEAPIINSTYSPQESLLSMIPHRSTNLETVKFGSMVGYEDVDSGIAQANVCDEAPDIMPMFDFCKIRFPLGRWQRQTKTGEIDHMLRKACSGLYDDFFFIGSIRGVSARPRMQFTPNDRNLIIEGALLRAMNGIGRSAARWMQARFWDGDPADSNGTADIRFLGLDLLMSSNYPVDLAAYLESSTGDVTACDRLNTDCKDFEEDCVGGGAKSIFEYIQEIDHTLTVRAMNSGVTREDLILVMHPVMLNEIAKAIPCEMVTNGCSGFVNASAEIPITRDGMFQMNERNRILNQRSITVNGNTYRIVLDSFIPVTNPANGEYISKIYMIPLRISGREVLYTEGLDYSSYERVLAPVQGLWNESVGWSDGGHYLHTIERTRTCFLVTTKFEPRLIFLGSRYSGCIENLKICGLQSKEIA